MDVQGFKFSGEPHEAATILEVNFANGSSVSVALPHESLATFLKGTLASLARCSVLRGQSSGGSPAPDPSPMKPPRVVGPAELVYAYLVSDVSWSERADGLSLVITFEHPDGEQTEASFSVEGAEVFAGHVRARCGLN